jgi:hypothetical protein|nr:MAG TPA: Minor capsid protein [Caudoviricetes sp.]
MSLTIQGLLRDSITICDSGSTDAFGTRPPEIRAANVSCRFVESGEQVWNRSNNGGGVVMLGTAQVWIDGDAPVQYGDTVIDDTTGKKYRVVKISKPKDLFETGVDHTKLVLE